MTSPVEALNAVMADMPGVPKGRKADPKQGGYAYRGIEDITLVLQPILAKHGVVFIPHVELIEIKDITVADKPWTDTILSVSYDIRSVGSDEVITCGPFIGIGRDNSDKGANKAMTQAWKYCLLQVLCIADQADDADGQHHEAPDQVARRATVARPELEARVERSKADGSSGPLREWWVANALPGIRELTDEEERMIMEKMNAEGWGEDHAAETAPEPTAGDGPDFEGISQDYDEWRKCFFAMLAEAHIPSDSRETIVEWVTSGRGGSTKILTTDERQGILKLLHALINGDAKSPLAHLVQP